MTKIPYRQEEFTTNIKGLPEGKNYFTELGYSQSYTWVEVSRSASGKTVTLARVNVASDPEWKEKMEWHVGGFTANCANQGQQTWLFESIDYKVTRKVRVCKSRYYDRDYAWASNGVEFVENRAREFYDYNF